MNGEIGTYTFLPWLRQGISNKIQSGDLDPSVTTRASITNSIFFRIGNVFFRTEASDS